MPVYILHGFRWPRAGFGGIRVHIVIHDLEDCSAEYIQNPHSHAELSKSFRNLYPEIMKQLDPPPFGGGKGIHFLEQYDPEDVTGENVVSQPYAFVSDRVVTIAGGGPGFSDRIGLDGSMVTTTTLTGASGLGTPTSVKGAGKGSVSAEIATNAAAKFQRTLSLSVEEVVAEGPGLTTAASEAFANLRDEIAPGEKIGWWVVYNGDPERACDSEDDDEEEEGEAEDDDYDDDDDDDDDDDVEADDYEQEGRDIVAKEADKQKSSQQPQPSHPTFPVLQRTRPSQPPPKPRIFEQKDPNLTPSDYTTIPTINPAPPPPPPPSPSSPLRSPPIKGVGKRLPGMKAAAPQPQPNQQQQQQQQQPMPQATRPKVVPKPESLKKKLFGKRG